MLKRASLIFKEEMLQRQIREGQSDKMIVQTMREISQVKSEIKNLQK